MKENNLIIQIEDFIVPQLNLDIGEARLYYYLLRNTRIVGLTEQIFSIAKIAEILTYSKNAVKPRLKSMAKKGLIEVLDTGWNGTRIRVYIPEEINNVNLHIITESALDLEELDFFKEAELRKHIIKLHSERCFYCGKLLNESNTCIDHIDPQIKGGTNSYKNLVAACHGCNSKKNDSSAIDYLRQVFRNDLISEEEFQIKKTLLDKIRTGDLRPTL
jgi:5-methylcytosine-specific restriction endonuclease McrA